MQAKRISPSPPLKILRYVRGIFNGLRYNKPSSELSRCFAKYLRTQIVAKVYYWVSLTGIVFIMNDDNPWEYKPDGKQASAMPGLPTTGAAPGAAPRTASGTSVSWTASEYIDHSRGADWYLGLVAGTVVLAAAVYFVTKDYFAGGVIAAVGIIVGVFSTHKPRQIQYELASTGLRVGDKSYPLSLFKSFALIREGALSSVNLVPIKRFMPPLSIYFDPSDEQKIVTILGEHLPLAEGGLDAVERLSRRLRL